MAIYDKLKKTGRRGVFYKEHEERKHGIKKDRLYILRYVIAGKQYLETFGWASAGKTEIDAEKKITEFRDNHRKGSGPVCLADERAIEEAAQQQMAAEQAKQARQSMAVADFFEQVYSPQCKADKALDTWKSEERLFRHWIKPVIGKLAFADISIEHLNKIKANMAAGKRAAVKPHPRDKSKKAKKAQAKRNPPRPMSPRSIQLALAVVRQVWNLACAVKPPLAFGAWPGAVKAFKKPKADNQRKRFLTKNEAATLLVALKAKSTDLHDMALLALHCGMRAGEIFKLTWDKVDLNRGELLLVDTKNGDSRISYLTDQAADVLRKRAIDCKHKRYVFATTKAGGSIGPHTAVPVTFSRTVAELGLNEGITDSRDKIVFHSLRHTYASWLVDYGTSLPIVRDLLGHKSLIMTSRYSHVSAQAQRDAVAALNRAIKPEGKNVVELDSKRKKS